MKTPASLMREHYPEFLKEMEVFKSTFGNVKREYMKCSVGEFGNEFKGTAINPTLSGNVLTTKELRRS